MAEPREGLSTPAAQAAAAQEARAATNAVRQPTVAELAARGRPSPYTGPDIHGLGRPEVKTLIPTVPRRHTHCVACGTAKLETRLGRDAAHNVEVPGHTGPSQRDHALCKPCYEQNGVLDRDFFARLERSAQFESAQVTIRNDPEWERIQASTVMTREERELQKLYRELDSALEPFTRSDAELERLRGRSLGLDDYFDAINAGDDKFPLKVNDLQHLSAGELPAEGAVRELPDVQPLADRVEGTVKWYDVERGIGMITPAEAERGADKTFAPVKDVFVHDSAVVGHARDLWPGMRVEMDVVQTAKGPAAESVAQYSRDVINAGPERASANAFFRPNFAANSELHAEALHLDKEWEQTRAVAHRLAYNAAKQMNDPSVAETLKARILEHWNHNPGQPGESTLDPRNPLAGIQAKERSPNEPRVYHSGQDEIAWGSGDHRHNHLVDRANEFASEHGIKLPDHNPESERGAPQIEQMPFQRAAEERAHEAVLRDPQGSFAVVDDAAAQYMRAVNPDLTEYQVTPHVPGQSFEVTDTATGERLGFLRVEKEIGVERLDGATTTAEWALHASNVNAIAEKLDVHAMDQAALTFGERASQHADVAAALERMGEFPHFSIDVPGQPGMDASSVQEAMVLANRLRHHDEMPFDTPVASLNGEPVYVAEQGRDYVFYTGQPTQDLAEIPANAIRVSGEASPSELYATVSDWSGTLAAQNPAPEHHPEVVEWKPGSEGLQQQYEVQRIPATGDFDVYAKTPEGPGAEPIARITVADRLEPMHLDGETRGPLDPHRDAVLADIAERVQGAQTVAAPALPSRDAEAVIGTAEAFGHRAELDKQIRGIADRIDDLTTASAAVSTAQLTTAARYDEFMAHAQLGFANPAQVKDVFNKIEPAAQADMIQKMTTNPAALSHISRVTDAAEVRQAGEAARHYVSARTDLDTALHRAADRIGHAPANPDAAIRDLQNQVRSANSEKARAQQAFGAIPRIAKDDLAAAYNRLSPVDQNRLKLARPDVGRVLGTVTRTATKTMDGPER